MATFFFCGIGGIGMSSIALYLKQSGHQVQGSDRSFDLKKPSAVQQNLIRAGIQLWPQDGSGVTENIDYFIVTRAVEDTILDVKKAQELGLTIKKRPDMLAAIFDLYKGIAIGGTSGKTTITAMLGHILHENGLDPTMINGGISLNEYNGAPCSNLIFGSGDYLVIEADESDRSIEKYTPYIAAVSNISLDHYAVDETRKMFEDFLNRTKHGIVINADCPETAKMTLRHPNIISVSVTNKKADLQAQNIQALQNGTRFELNHMVVELPVIGVHNVANALTAIGAALHAGIAVKDSIKALCSFKGTKRRLQNMGTQGDITVFDDYAHNPEKVRAALKALMQYPGHIYALYQPHGFAPLRLTKNDFVKMLKETLTDQVTFIMNDIYYVGGTVAQDVSCEDVTLPVAAAGKDIRYIGSRTDTLAYLKQHMRPKDRIIVMGARDDSLSDFALDILNSVQEKAA